MPDTFLPTGHRFQEFSFSIDWRSTSRGPYSRPAIEGWYLNAGYANEGQATDIAKDVLLTPTAFAAILGAAEDAVGPNALKSPGLRRTGEELADAGLQRARSDLAAVKKLRAELDEQERVLLKAVSDAEVAKATANFDPGTCRGCGRELGSRHTDDCAYSSRRRVDTAHTRIAPV